MANVNETREIVKHNDSGELFQNQSSGTTTQVNSTKSIENSRQGAELFPK